VADLNIASLAAYMNQLSFSFRNTPWLASANLVCFSAMPNASRFRGPAILVIADDLTGANDAGVQFAAAGIRSIVFANHQLARLPEGYPAVVINTESRHIAPEQAAERVRKIGQLRMAAGVRCFYKKTDSTLRGNIGAELEALLSTTGVAAIPFVPALPDLGRTTKNGIHHVHGVPIGETAFARDPLNPIRASRVSEVLAAQARGPICSVKSPLEASSGIAVVDCESNEDLRQIARTLAEADRLQVVSGSVGLARYLVEYLGISSNPPDEPAPQLPILLVNGSVNERALEQIERGCGNFSKVRLSPESLIGGQAHLTIPSGGNLLVCSISKREELQAYNDYAWSRGISEKQLHLQVAEHTGNIVRQILAAGVFRTVVVFGGDTLAGIARANHWQKFEPLAELEPGVSISVPSGSGLTLISKAGGFGDLEVVSRIVGFVQAHQN
jgi:uncharacterized protein YgbK (DUF1537 family)